MEARDLSPRKFHQPQGACASHNLSNQQLIPIYTEWANRFLARTKLKPVRDLAAELCIPRTLVGLVHAVTNDCAKSSRDTLQCSLNSTEPVEAIRKCLKYLSDLGVNVANVRAENIEKGHLGAILTLLYALSYFKQQQRAALKFAAPESLSTKATTTTVGNGAKWKKNGSTTIIEPYSTYYYSSVQSTSSGYSSGNYATVADLWEDGSAAQSRPTVVHSLVEQQQQQQQQKQEQQGQDAPKPAKAALKRQRAADKAADQSRKAVKKVVAFKMPPNSSPSAAPAAANSSLRLPTANIATRNVRKSETGLKVPSQLPSAANSVTRPKLSLDTPPYSDSRDSSSSDALLTAAVQHAKQRQQEHERLRQQQQKPEPTTSSQQPQPQQQQAKLRGSALPRHSASPAGILKSRSTLTASSLHLSEGIRPPVQASQTILTETSQRERLTRLDSPSPTVQESPADGKPQVQTSASALRAPLSVSSRIGRLAPRGHESGVLKAPPRTTATKIAGENCTMALQQPQQQQQVQKQQEQQQHESRASRAKLVAPNVRAKVPVNRISKPPGHSEETRLASFGSSDPHIRDPAMAVPSQNITTVPPQNITAASRNAEKPLLSLLSPTTSTTTTTTTKLSASPKDCEAICGTSSMINDTSKLALETKGAESMPKSRLLAPAASKLARLRSPSSHNLDDSIEKGVANRTAQPPSEKPASCEASGVSIALAPAAGSSSLRTPSRIRGRTSAAPALKSTSTSLSASQASSSSLLSSSVLGGGATSASQSSDASLSVQVAPVGRQKPAMSTGQSRLSRPKSRLALNSVRPIAAEASSVTCAPSTSASSGCVGETRPSGSLKQVGDTPSTAEYTERRPTLAVKGILAPNNRIPTRQNVQEPNYQQQKLTSQQQQQQSHYQNSVIGVVSPMLQKQQRPADAVSGKDATKTRVDALADAAKRRVNANASPQMPPPMAPPPAAHFTNGKPHNSAKTETVPTSQLHPSASAEGCEALVDIAQDEYDKEICRLTTAQGAQIKSGIGAAQRKYRSLDRQRRSPHYDSYEDSSSSISSGVSENLDDISTDDLTGSSSDFHAGGFSPPEMSAANARNRASTAAADYGAPAVPSRQNFARLSGARFGYGRRQKSYNEPAVYSNFDEVGDYDNLGGPADVPSPAICPENGARERLSVNSGGSTTTRNGITYRNSYARSRLSHDADLDEEDFGAAFYNAAQSHRYHTVNGPLNLAEAAAALGVPHSHFSAGAGVSHSSSSSSSCAPPRILSPPPTLQQHLAMLSADGETLSCALPNGGAPPSALPQFVTPRGASSDASSSATHSAASTVKEAAAFRAAKLKHPLASGGAGSPSSPHTVSTSSDGYGRIQRGLANGEKAYVALQQMKNKQQQPQPYSLQQSQQLLQLQQQQIRPQNRPQQPSNNARNNGSSNNNGAYHTHSLDRHAHLKIFSLPSSSAAAAASPRHVAGGSSAALLSMNGAGRTYQHGAGEGLISAPSSPYHHSFGGSDAYKFAAASSNDPVDYDSLSARHSVSASRKFSRHKSPGYASFRRAPAAAGAGVFTRALNGGNNSMSRSMILLHENGSTNNNNEENLYEQQQRKQQMLRKKEQLQRELEAGLRRVGCASSHMARRTGGAHAQLSLPPGGLDDSVYACRSEISAAYGCRQNGSLSARAACDSSAAYANGLQLHKLSLSGGQAASGDAPLARSSSIRSNGDTSHGYISFKKVNGVAIPNVPTAMNGGGSPSPAHHPTAFATMEERYAYELNKLNAEMGAYRSTISTLTARHDGYNHLILTFNTRLQAMVKQVEKLRKTSHLKKSDAEKLRNEIEQLRLLSCNAGVAVPSTIAGGGAVPADGAEHLLRRQPSLESLLAQQQQKQYTAGAANGSGSVSAAATPFKIAKASTGGGDKPRSSKKSSWIRSSFSRAFYKSGGKKSKSKGETTTSEMEQSPLRCAVAGAAAAASVATSATVTDTSAIPAPGNNGIDPMDHFSLRENDFLSTEALLKKQLEDKDLALTDVRLDALDKAREVDILRETVHRLKNENKILKHNFTVLEQRIRNESRASSQQSLSTCCQDVESEVHAPTNDAPAATMAVGSGTIHVSGNSACSSGFYNGAVAVNNGGGRTGSATTASSIKTCNASILSGNAGSMHHGTDRSFSSSFSSKRSSSGMTIRVSLCVDFSGKLDFGSPASCAASPISAPAGAPSPATRNSLTLSASHNQFSQCANPSSDGNAMLGRGLAAASAGCGSSCTIASTASSSSGCALSIASGGSAISAGGVTGESFGSRRELTIGYLPVPSTSSAHLTTWDDVDQQLGVLLEDYLHRIDPEMSLGIANSFTTIIGYQLCGCGASGEESFVRVRAANRTVQNTPAMTSCGDSDDLSDEGFNDLTERSAANDAPDYGRVPPQSPAQFLTSNSTIRLRLSGAAQNSLDALVLESLFPKSVLRQLLNHLVQSRRLLIYGGTGIGKSNLARYLAKYLAMCMRIDAKNVIDLHFPDDDRDAGRIQQVQDQLISVLKCTTGGGAQPQVLILDNIQRKRIDSISDAFVSADTALAACDGNNPPPFIICTLNRTSESPAQRLQIHHNFRLFSLNSKMDAVKGYMGRYLRRRIAEEELGGTSTRQSSHGQFLHHGQLQHHRPYRHYEFNAVIEFLGRVLDAVNEFIENANAFDVTLGPRIFLQCPLHVDASRDWFVELWNEKIVPYMSKVARDSKSFLGARGLLKDPTLNLYEHWPWIDEGARAESLLLHVNLDQAPSTGPTSSTTAQDSHMSYDGIRSAKKSGDLLLTNPRDFDAIHALERIEENRGS